MAGSSFWILTGFRPEPLKTLHPFVRMRPAAALLGKNLYVCHTCKAQGFENPGDRELNAPGFSVVGNRERILLVLRTHVLHDGDIVIKGQ